MCQYEATWGVTGHCIQKTETSKERRVIEMAVAEAFPPGDGGDWEAIWGGKIEYAVCKKDY